MKIDKHSLHVIEEWCDTIAFYDKEIFVSKQGDGLNKKGKAITTNKRILHLDGTSASMINGNSFGLPNVEVELNACADIMEWMLTGPYKEEQTKTKTKNEEK